MLRPFLLGENQMKMLRKLRKLGFSEKIKTFSIDKTIEVMHDEIDANLDLSCAVLTEMEDDFAPYSVTKENHAMKLQDWVEDHANAIHKEQMQKIIYPFKAIARLLFD